MTLSEWTERLTITGFGRGATATDDAVQQGAMFHVKHDAQQPGPHCRDTPAYGGSAACVEYVCPFRA